MRLKFPWRVVQVSASDSRPSCANRKPVPGQRGLPHIHRHYLILIVPLVLMSLLVWALSSISAPFDSPPLAAQCEELVVTRKGEIDGYAPQSAYQRGMYCQASSRFAVAQILGCRAGRGATCRDGLVSQHLDAVHLPSHPKPQLRMEPMTHDGSTGIHLALPHRARVPLVSC